MVKTFLVSGLALFMVIFTIPQIVEAQEFGDLQTREEVMRYIERQAMGEEQHTEAARLMQRLIAGVLTEEEANRLAELLRENPGGVMMMAHRMGMSEMGEMMRRMRGDTPGS
ncbi:MAG: hypothetical protein Q8P39_01295 [Candidatus Yanofskybacteria bacterium]|nr:hypothetical protein [Candidatus Yanofskybacteria bacterium]